jgi:O-antigen/teichoic acid export membrane protein
MTAPSLQQTARRGIRWSALSQVGRQVVQIATLAVLARVLAPRDFGLFGMATIVSGFVALFRDLGTGAAVVQAREVDDAFLSGVFWFNVAAGLALLGVSLAMAPLVAHIFGEPRVGSVLSTLALSFPVSALGTVHQAMLERRLAFDRLATVELCAALVGAAVGISLACTGYGVWSLVGQTLAAAAVGTALLCLGARWRPRLQLALPRLRQVASFSLQLTGNNVLNYAVRNGDAFLLGKYWGAQELGYYNLAYRVLLFPVQNIAHVVARVTFPLYARLQDDDAAVRRIYLRVAVAIALVAFPLMITVAIAARPIVLVFFGPAWEPAALLISILAPIGMLQSIGTTVGGIFQAKGRADLLFRWGLMAGVIYMISFATGLRWGAVGVAACYAAAAVLLHYPGLAIPLRLIHLRMSDLVGALVRPLVCAAFAGLCALGTHAAASAWHRQGPGLSHLTAVVGTALLAYAASSWFWNRQQIDDLLREIRSR